MPIARFECGRCGLKFWDLVMEGWQIKCPECGEKRNLKRVIGGFSVRYKGRGFHGKRRRK